MDRENYFILLNLDPSITDDNQIEDTIKSKQREWSSLRNHPSKGGQAQNNLDQLKDIRNVMIDNPPMREAERTEAISLLEQKKEKAKESLISTIRHLSLKGYLTEKEVNKLKEKNEHFTEQEIRKLIEPNEIRSDDHKNVKTAKPVIDQTILQGIQKELKIIQKQDLYDFLGMNRNSSIESLKKRIDIKAVEIKKNNNKNANLTAQDNLIGYCLKIFQNETERSKYDNSKSLKKLLELEKDIEILGTSGTISVDAWDYIINQAKAKGIPQADAEDCITNYARKKAWIIEKPSTPTGKKLISCGNCHAMNDETSKKCVNCKEDLYVPCIKCKTLNVSENKYCSNCGFSLADYFTISELLKEANLKVAHRNWGEARKLLDEAEIYWPGYDKILQIKQRIIEEEKKEFQELKKIEDFISSCHLYQAKKQVQMLKQQIGTHPSIEILEKQIDNGIQKSQLFIQKAEQYENAGDTQKALESYLEVLQFCQDDPFVSNKLITYPPPSPSGLRIEVFGDAIILNWDDVPEDHVLFRVVRKENKPPVSCKDGTIVSETSALQYVDKNCLPGIGYYYAIYSIRANVLSKKSAVSSEPAFYAPDIENLNIIPGDNIIQFKWKPLQNAIKIKIWKKDNDLPDGPNDGTYFQISGNEFIDDNVVNGSTYGYLFVAVFEWNNQFIHSKGETHLIQMTIPPKPITDLQYKVLDNIITLSWSPVESDRVHIYKSTQKSKLKIMDVISVDQMNQLGEKLVETNEDRASFNANDDNTMFVTPVTQKDNHCVVGNRIMISNIADVYGTEASIYRGQIKLKWLWPRNIEYVAIMFKDSNYATDPNDLNAEKKFLSREKYQNKGFFSKQVENDESLYITIFSAVKQDEEWLYSSGNTKECRKYFLTTKSVTIRYMIQEKKILGLFRSKVYDLIISSDRKINLPKLVLAAKKTKLPRNRNDGIELLAITDERECEPNQLITIGSFKSDTLERNLKAMLFAENEDDYAWLKLTRLPQTVNINS